MKLLFVARAIDRMAGGVERIITALMNALSARGHQVNLLTWDLVNAQSFYPIEPEIIWYRLGLGDPKVRASAALMMRRCRAVRRAIRRAKPQVIVCFQDGPFRAICGYTLGLGVPIIAAERNAPDRFDHISAARYQGIIYQTLRFAARVTIQCESYRDLYPDFLQPRLVCIPNPVQPASVRARPDAPNKEGRYRLLSVGRLSFQKNYRVLIEAFSRLAARYANWDLAIVGEGEDRIQLEQLTRTLGLESRVVLPGVTKNIGEWYASSHLFCLSSRWEGFPNALAEALAHGLPAVGFAGCAGVRDLIAHGRSGLLAAGNGDAGSLALALEKAMSNSDLRRSMGSEAIIGVQPYHPSQIFSKWEELLSEVTSS
jgi:GalNAc-alpha-(1->4)-GalNAc-alpha-(1->3)-diNAcBac-PP-undecaprenol alpha-1,4-N-acetyl-D-galactosaminyltransferase